LYVGFPVPLAATVAMEWTPDNAISLQLILAADNIPPGATRVNHWPEPGGQTIGWAGSGRPPPLLRGRPTVAAIDHETYRAAIEARPASQVLGVGGFSAPRGNGGLADGPA
jgi:hypothetical protein